jgi:hypothetical protein
MATLTTEQELPFAFAFKDGMGRPAVFEGDPVAVTSDPTVATVAMSKDASGVWSGLVSSVVPGSAQIAVSVDSDLGEGVNTIIGTLLVEVTLDPRTGERIMELTAGTPHDKPAT